MEVLAKRGLDSGMVEWLRLDSPRFGGELTCCLFFIFLAYLLVLTGSCSLFSAFLVVLNASCYCLCVLLVLVVYFGIFE